MLSKFESVLNGDKYAYAYEFCGFTTGAEINHSFRMFQTYGDGICQHSGDWPITKDFLADYLLSLSAAMLKDDELCENLHYTIARRPSKAEIEFAASVVFKPGSEGSSYEKKTRYFSIPEKKITAHPQKQFDKRYSEIRLCHDGSPTAIYNMLLPDYSDGLMMFQWSTAIRNWILDLPDSGPYMPLPAIFLKWTTDQAKARELNHAFECVCNVVAAYRLRSNAQSELDRVRQNLERVKEQQAATAATTEGQ